MHDTGLVHTGHAWLTDIDHAWPVDTDHAWLVDTDHAWLVDTGHAQLVDTDHAQLVDIDHAWLVDTAGNHVMNIIVASYQIGKVCLFGKVATKMMEMNVLHPPGCFNATLCQNIYFNCGIQYL